MPALARIGARRLRLLLAATIVATLLPAAAGSALPGSDNFQDAPALLFSVPGSVDNPTLRASSAVRPANDDRTSAAELASDVPTAVSNAGASQETGELLTCATTGYAATMWFRWTAPAIGDVVLSTSATFETALTVYRAGDGTVVACATGSQPRVPLRVASGEAFLLQVAAKSADGIGLGQGPITTTAAFTMDQDADHDGELAFTDCNDNNPAIRHGVVDNPDDGIDQDCSGGDAVNLDRDGDGFNRGASGGDCNDADRKIHPQAFDIPGNAIDEDCAGGPAPFPRLASGVTFEITLPFRFLSLRVVRAVAGSRIELRCSGSGCFKRKAIHVRKASAVPSLLRFVAKARPKRGAVVEVRITKPGTIGFMKRFTARGAKKKPKVQELCLAPGTGRSQHC